MLYATKELVFGKKDILKQMSDIWIVHLYSNGDITCFVWLFCCFMHLFLQPYVVASHATNIFTHHY
jgi:hypothetical protein